jgi:hypothetical protein
MTRTQVAELYGVAIEEVERILSYSAPKASHAARYK